MKHFVRVARTVTEYADIEVGAENAAAAEDEAMRLISDADCIADVAEFEAAVDGGEQITTVGAWKDGDPNPFE